MFTALQSTLHMDWAWYRSSTLGGSTINYSPSDCFETFPFPACLRDEGASGAAAAQREQLEQIGARYHSQRQQLMQERQEGLTKIYNRFHDRSERSADISELRRLHVAMDNAVAAAYGWSDLELGHSFHETKQGLRYTISEGARRRILDRLLQLNQERHAASEGVSRGVQGSGGKGSAAKRTGAKRTGASGEGAGVANQALPLDIPDPF
jgi:predicted NUDIX family NTP pyrophosphohydrolase